METIDHRDVAFFDTRGMIGTIYHGDYQTLLHTKYSLEAVGLVVSEIKIFLVFPIVSLWELSCCHGHNNFETICSKT